MASAKGLIVQEVVKSGHIRFLHFPTGWNVRLAEGALQVLDGANHVIGTFAAGEWANVMHGNAVYWTDGDKQGGPIELIEGDSKAK